ncbi:MAG TPA: DHA2 family efflux MFS transporter permease subunit [Polyangiaceae bacterium]|jgi:EmrB/QacA subfamily drug resistance transporter|nr:DHA2 family efflux MFS transporter permease subunit [Polyangiaceae bacterium]
MMTFLEPARPAARPLRLNLVLAICCLSLFIVSMDATIVNVALPAIRRDLQATTSGLQWIVDAYTLVVASVTMLSGSLADRFGRRRTFQTGLTVFTLASTLCSIAPNLHALVGARMLQALGGSMLNPVAMSIITNTFLDPKARARAIGVWGAVFGISAVLGPLVGGTLTQSVGWRSIFWINVPIGVAAILLAQRFVPESKAPRARRVDPIGQLFVSLAFGSTIYATIEGNRLGWSSPLILGLFTLALCSLVGILIYEPRQREPLLDLRFFRSIPFSSATIIAVSMFSALSGFGFLNALYLQEVRGLSALQAGLYMVPLALGTILSSPISGRLIGRYGTRIPLAISGSMTALSGLALTRLDVATPLSELVCVYLIFGIAVGLVNPPITNTAVSGMPRAQAGLAAAIASTSRLFGASLGVAISGTLAGDRHVGLAFTQSTHAFWWLMAGAGSLCVFLGLLSNGRSARASVARIAALLDDAAPFAEVK